MPFKPRTQMIRYRTTFTIIVLVTLTSAAAVCCQVDEPAELFAKMSQRAAEIEDDLIEFRHDIHRHPEISGSEVRTAGLVADRLRELGFTVRTGVGGHGVVGVLEGAQPSPMVAFRADMDAVPSRDPDPVDYRSVIPGVRHICGHDIHTTIGIGLAESFASARESLKGSVMLIFQPSEERGTGAKSMLADAVFEAHKPDAIFAVHTAPYDVGEISTVEGGMMSGRARVSVAVTGTDRPGEAVEKVRKALQSVGTIHPDLVGQTAPKGFIMVQLFSIGAGNGNPVRGQIMTAGLEDRERAKTAVMEALRSLDLPGITLETSYDERFLEGVNNDAELVARANAGIGRLAPEITIRTVGGAVPAFSEDFGSFQAELPGIMYFLGVSNPETGTVGMPHRSDYVADDASILVGTRAILAAMVERLSNW